LKKMAPASVLPAGALVAYHVGGQGHFDTRRKNLLLGV